MTPPKIDKEQFKITSEKMWLFAQFMYTKGSETFDNGTRSAEKAGYAGDHRTLEQIAYRLVRNSKIINAKAVIVAGTGADAEYTLLQYQKQLEAARDRAERWKQPSAEVSAIVAKGRSMGYDKSNDINSIKPPTPLTEEEAELCRKSSKSLTLLRLSKGA